jgi:hypothetical protein
MDGCGEQEHDHTHLRDLLTSSASSLVSPVSGGSENGKVSELPNTKGGFGHVTSPQFRNTPITKLRKSPQAYPSHPDPLPDSPMASRNLRSTVHLDRHGDRYRAALDHSAVRHHANPRVAATLIRPEFWWLVSHPDG